MRTLRFLSASAALGLAIFTSSSLPAATWTLDFNNDNDDAWLSYNLVGSATFTFSSGAYRIEVEPPNTADFGPGRAGILLNDVTVTNFTISVDVVNWAAELPQSFGIVARVNNLGLGETNGYFFSYSPGESAGRSHHGELEIARFDNEIRQTDALASLGLEEDLNPAVGYRFVFSGVGSLLTGSVYALTNLDTALATVYFEDDTYLTGGVGLLVTDSSAHSLGLGPADATFDNFSVSTIPEPSTYALMFGGAALGFVVCRRRFPRATVATHNTR